MYGGEISEAEYFDKDGVIVSIVLNLDHTGRLYEYDSWKVDFSERIALPEVRKLRFIKSDDT